MSEHDPQPITEEIMGSKEPIKPKDEVERKFLIDLDDLPFNPGDFPRIHIEQGYLQILDSGTEIRVRASSMQFQEAKYTLTIKQPGTVSRPETEVPISEEDYLELWPGTEGRRIDKTRHEISHEDSTHTIELDVYAGANAGTVVAEVEFADETEAEKFAPPEWFGAEVTELRQYKNQNLAS